MGRDTPDDEQETGKSDAKICTCNADEKASENMGISEYNAAVFCCKVFCVYLYILTLLCF